MQKIFKSVFFNIILNLMYVVIYIAVIVIIAIREKDKKTISKRKRLSQCIFLTSASFNTEVTEELKQTMSSIAQDKVHGIEGLKQLLDHCADPNIPDIPDKWGKTALMWAINKEHKDIVAVLLNYGADVYIQTRYGFTALTIARRVNNFEILKLIQQKIEQEME